MRFPLKQRDALRLDIWLLELSEVNKPGFLAFAVLWKLLLEHIKLKDRIF